MRRIGGVELPDAKKGDSIYYVLDGQQRVTSIYASMCGVKIGKDDYAEIYIDLDADETQEIVIMDISNKSVDSIISINALLNNKLFIDLCLKFAQNAEYIEKIQKYKEKFTTYQFPIIEITEASLDTATDIFTRINVGGKGLDVFEIMCAKTYDEEKGFDLYEKREQQLEIWEEIGYETIPHSTILQAISLCINGGCSKKHILNCITKDDFRLFVNSWGAKSHTETIPNFV